MTKHTELFGTNLSVDTLKKYIPKCKDCLRAFFISEIDFTIRQVHDTVMFTFSVDDDDDYVEYIDGVMIYFSAINDCLDNCLKE